MYYEFMVKGKIANWLFNEFLEWQKTQGRKMPQYKFANYLGVKPSTYSMWISGKQDPDPYNTDKIANKLGPKVYEIMGMTPPPEFIKKLVAVYDELTPDQRHQLQKRIAELLSEYIDSQNPAPPN